MAFRENILHLRSVNNMTQEQLAVYIGVSRQSVAKWEAGKAYPEMDKLIKLSQIFNCTIDDLVQGDLTNTEPDTNVVTPDTNQDLFGYDEFMRHFANKISNGVMSIILGVAFGVLLFCIGDEDSTLYLADNLRNIFNTFGLFCVLGGVAIGLYSIIPAGLDYSAFVREHPYLEDFYTSGQKQDARKSFSSQLMTGIILIFVGICLVIGLDLSPISELFSPFSLLICIAIAVKLFISAGMTLSRVDISTYNRQAHEARLQEAAYNPNNSSLSEEELEAAKSIRKTDNRIGTWCGIIMIIATIVGLVMLFVPEYFSPLFWLAWPIGGLLCGIVSLLFKAFSGKDN